jgi:hypothetical protein
VPTLVEPLVFQQVWPLASPLLQLFFALQLWLPFSSQWPLFIPSVQAIQITL